MKRVSTFKIAGRGLVIAAPLWLLILLPFILILLHESVRMLTTAKTKVPKTGSCTKGRKNDYFTHRVGG